MNTILAMTGPHINDIEGTGTELVEVKEHDNRYMTSEVNVFGRTCKLFDVLCRGIRLSINDISIVSSEPSGKFQYDINILCNPELEGQTPKTINIRFITRRENLVKFSKVPINKVKKMEFSISHEPDGLHYSVAFYENNCIGGYYFNAAGDSLSVFDFDIVSTDSPLASITSVVRTKN